ncbi:putative late blight resistance protein R1B-17 isoform X2 [Salvia divinorum]|uniref:Late blight resistance protein R1B-17 isoform X2 n=1 Tax=Salvia divinorum TaxID=28513 RepID=A0ABD1H2S7_SALDI
MAYAAVASLSHTIDIFLNYHQHSISPQLKDAIASLHKHTVFLQTFFDDFPDKTDLWEEIISEATYMAERIIELQLSDSLLESTVGSSRSRLEQGEYQLPYGFDELKRVTKEIESIVGELKGTKTMDGPDDELIEIISRLREGSQTTIGIYGKEGAGKTTLARNAYNNPLIVEHFDIRAWVTVSGKYDQHLVVRDLLRSMKIESSSNIENELIQTLLQKLKGRSFEETGEEYVEDLVRRNLVRVSKRKSNGRIKRIKIDSRLSDVCLKQGHVDSFVPQSDRFSICEVQALPVELKSCHRRVSTRIYYDYPEGHDSLEGVHGSTIRTLMLEYEVYKKKQQFRLSIKNVRLLRILDLSHACHFDLPEEVFELFHLRYLAFHSGFSISEAISNLENLQTLFIYPRESDCIFANLPEGIWRMPQLRHLRVFRFELPSPKGALEDLQTLSRVVDFTCSREHLKMIPNLKKLALFYTNMSRDYELHNLIYLEKLEVLKIEMDWSLVGKHNMSCVFPRKLMSLNLCGLQLPWEDMKIVASLPNLQVLKLRKLACIGKTWETSAGGFGQLTYLLIQESYLEHWIMEASHFPRLKSLVLHHCWNLNEPNGFKRNDEGWDTIASLLIMRIECLVAVSLRLRARRKLSFFPIQNRTRKKLSGERSPILLEVVDSLYLSAPAHLTKTVIVWSRNTYRAKSGRMGRIPCCGWEHIRGTVPFWCAAPPAVLPSTAGDPSPQKCG